MRLLASELLKIRTAPRTVLGLLLAELAIVAIGSASVIDASDESVDEFGTRPDLETDLIDVTSAVLLFAVILGVLLITWEYRHGTISQTFLVTPVRERVIAVKALVAGLAGAALVVPALVLMLVIAELWVSDRLEFRGHDLGSVGRVFLACALAAVFGMEIGAITARQLGAIVLVFGWAIFAEPALAFWGGIEKYLPVHALFGGVLGFAEDSSFPFGRAGVTLVVYAVVLGVLAIAITRRRDIT
jgi:ABC-2 type transport system permease protein